MIEISPYHYIDFIGIAMMTLIYALILMPPFLAWKGLRRFHEARKKAQRLS